MIPGDDSVVCVLERVGGVLFKLGGLQECSSLAGIMDRVTLDGWFYTESKRHLSAVVSMWVRVLKEPHPEEQFSSRALSTWISSTDSGPLRFPGLWQTAT